MNVPFPPVFLWLLLPLIVWASRRWHRRAIEKVMRRLETQAAENPPDTPSRVTRKDAAWMSCHWVILGGFLVLYLALQLALFSAPPVRGRITDRETGEPIVGATVRRSFYVTIGFQIVESPSAAKLGATGQKTTTRDDGTFFLPGFLNLWPAGFNGLSGFGWVVTHPDYVPIFDCQQQGFYPIGEYNKGCGYFGDALAPWARATWQVGILSAKLQLAVRRASTQEAAANSIRRMSDLLSQRAVGPQEVVVAAKAYVARWPLNDELAQAIFSSEEMLGRLDVKTGKLDGIAEAAQLVSILEDYCSSNHHSEFCSKHRSLLNFARGFVERHGSEQ